jgi:superfamily II DNA or RNA helicase
MIIVHTKDLAFQWSHQFLSFLRIPEMRSVLFGSGRYEIGRRSQLALVQSIYSVPRRLPAHWPFGVDECQRTPSRTFTERNLFNSKYIAGLSATLGEENGCQIDIWLLEGSIMR